MAGDTFTPISARLGGISVSALEAANPGVGPTALKIVLASRQSHQPPNQATRQYPFFTRSCTRLSHCLSIQRPRPLNLGPIHHTGLKLQINEPQPQRLEILLH